MCIDAFSIQDEDCTFESILDDVLKTVADYRYADMRIDFA